MGSVELLTIYTFLNEIIRIIDSDFIRRSFFMNISIYVSVLTDTRTKGSVKPGLVLTLTLTKYSENIFHS